MITEAGMTETDAAALMKTQQSVRVNEGRVPMKSFSLFSLFYLTYVKKIQKECRYGTYSRRLRPTPTSPTYSRLLWL